MSGQIVRKGHECAPPGGETRGAVWRCDCGQHWRLYSRSGWLTMSVLDVLRMKLTPARRQPSEPAASVGDPAIGGSAVDAGGSPE